MYNKTLTINSISYLTGSLPNYKGIMNLAAAHVKTLLRDLVKRH